MLLTQAGSGSINSPLAPFLPVFSITNPDGPIGLLGIIGFPPPCRQCLRWNLLHRESRHGRRITYTRGDGAYAVGKCCPSGEGLFRKVNSDCAFCGEEAVKILQFLVRVTSEILLIPPPSDSFAVDLQSFAVVCHQPAGPGAVGVCVCVLEAPGAERRPLPRARRTNSAARKG